MCVHEPDDHSLILKHPFCVRIFHYFLVLSFIPPAITGVFLFLKPFEESAMNQFMRVHVLLGGVLSFAALSFLIMAFDRVVLFIKRSFSVSMNDVKWFSVLGGYPQKFLLGKKVPVPPMGKYNSGQKLFGVCVFIGGVILIATGLSLWVFPHLLPHGTARLFGNLHLVIGLFLTLFLCVHIFLGIYMSSDFKAMFLHGKIPYKEASEAAPLWVRNDLVCIKKE